MKMPLYCRVNLFNLEKIKVSIIFTKEKKDSKNSKNSKKIIAKSYDGRRRKR